MQKIVSSKNPSPFGHCHISGEHLSSQLNDNRILQFKCESNTCTPKNFSRDNLERWFKSTSQKECPSCGDCLGHARENLINRYNLNILDSEKLEWIKKAFERSELSLVATYLKEISQLKFENGRTGLHMAVEANAPTLLKYLIGQKSMSINGQDFEGYTPLHYAMKNKNSTCLKLLLNQDELNLDSTLNNSGESPLHFAVEANFVEGVKLLLKNQAKFGVRRDSDQLFPIEIAQLKNYDEIVTLLMDAELPKFRYMECDFQSLFDSMAVCFSR